MRVSVFGGANPKPGSQAYENARLLGQQLATHGHDVLTGGYVGSMEAVSRGAAEKGGHVIGVTCTEIERWRPGKANPWVKEEWKMPTLDTRLLKLIDCCDAAMALPGGPGTLAEIALMWNRMLIHAIPTRPLILIGKEWQTVFACMFSELDAYIAQRDRQMLSFAPGIQEAINHLRQVQPPFA
ncbi:MAG: LOG family protein [Anaerolineae bacterium]|nr:LOG family protein [Anaerolineae bacterium]